MIKKRTKIEKNQAKITKKTKKVMIVEVKIEEVRIEKVQIEVTEEVKTEKKKVMRKKITEKINAKIIKNLLMIVY